MKIDEKFLKGKDSHTYQRVDSTYKSNVFLGYTDDGNMSMVLIENGKNEKIKSSQVIEVSLRRREDKKYVLSFDLLDPVYSTLFMIFCKDIIMVCEKVGNEHAISNAIKRWNYWKEMFGRRNSQLLDKQKIRGLVGELIELRDYFIPQNGIEKSIEAWMGPLFGRKDFEIQDTWYEIKTISDGAIQVTISSLEQLDADNDGHMHVVKLEESSSVTNISFNLNDLVLEIISMIDSLEVMDAFKMRLEKIGYAPNDGYDSYNFIYKGTNKYKVNDEFPRLSRKNINLAIGNVKYTILLNSIEKFREE